MQQTANCSNGFKRFQTMNRGLIKRNDRSFKKITKFKFYKLKCSPCSAALRCTSV